ncbi:MAG: VOC family protein [Candidatus Binatia bacterium]|nr:VOC family protein [Candidatus Binatia bacterium]
MNIKAVFHLAVNCTDFTRSRAFYEALGFQVVWEVPEEGTDEIAAACGLTEYKIRGALMALPGESTLIDLLEWQAPRDHTPPYPDIARLGIARIALHSTDLEADMAELKKMDVEFIGPPATVAALGAAGTRFVCFKDPDGTILELVEVLEG